MLAACLTAATVQMITSLGGDIKPLALSPSPPHVEIYLGMQKIPHPDHKE